MMKTREHGQPRERSGFLFSFWVYPALAVIFLATSNCKTSSDVKNKSSVSNSAPITKPSPSPSPSALPSTASQKDGINDVADGNGSKPPTKLSGMDLVGVLLEVTDSDLKVTVEANDPFPTSVPAGKSVLWQVEAWSQDKSQGYYLGAKLVESKWYVFVFNLKTYANEYVSSPSVSGKKLVASYPLRQLPNLIPSFTWSATAEYDGKWRDKIPDEGKVSFPAS
jgi:hypothetical protein